MVDKNKTEAAQRREASGQTVYLPLPNYILDNIFDQSMASIVLNRFMTNLGDWGSWNRTNGLYVHNRTGLIFCLAATQENIITLKRAFNTFGSVWHIKNNADYNVENKLKKLNSLGEILGSNISLVQPYEFKVEDLSILIQKHFGNPPSHIFIRDMGTNYAGTIRVSSRPTQQAILDINPSHPVMVAESYIKAQQQHLSSSDPLADIKVLLNSQYDNTATTKYAPNPNPKPEQYIESIDKHQVYNQGAHEFLNNSNQKQIPIATIGRDTFGNTASISYRGTPHESTMTALCSNPLVSFPSSSFYPHPYWLSSIFSTPLSVLRDPKAATAIIAIALLTSSKDNRKYIDNYNSFSSVVDNEKLEQDLFGGL